MHSLRPQVISHANFIRPSRAPGWVVGAGERLDFHGEVDQVEIFQDEKPKNLILNLPLHFFSGNCGKVSHSKRI